MSLYDSLLEKMDGRPYSNYFSCYCIFESHEKPALLVYEDGFICLSCGKNGTIEYLAKRIGTHFIPQQLTQSHSNVLPRWRGWEQKWGDLEGIAKHAHKSLLSFPQFQAYFRKRKIDEFIEKGCLGYIDGWVTFPCRDRVGTVVDIVVRSVSGKGDIRYVVAPRNGIGDNLRSLYVPSWDRVIKADTVYVVYGIIDAIAMELVGLPVITGTTGKSLSAELLKPLGKKFIIIPDLGEEREAYLLANKLGWRAIVKTLMYENNTKDPDSVRIKFGNEYLLQLIGA